MKRKGSGLGKGLGALLPETTAGADEVSMIAVGRIVPNAHQPRREFEPAALCSRCWFVAMMTGICSWRVNGGGGRRNWQDSMKYRLSCVNMTIPLGRQSR